MSESAHTPLFFLEVSANVSVKRGVNEAQRAGRKTFKELEPAVSVSAVDQWLSVVL